jgi:hypothetical protein
MYSFQKTGWFIWAVLAVVLIGCARTAPRAVAAPVTASVTVTGTVQLPDGKPAAGARAFLSYSNQGIQCAEQPAGADGRFSFTTAVTARYTGVTVGARQPGFAATWVRAKSGDDVTLHLGATPVPLQGMVVDMAGQPIAGAEVAAVQFLGRTKPGVFFGYSSTLFGSLTGPDGRFLIPDLAAGDRVRYTVIAPGCAAIMDNADLPEPDQIIMLPPEATISGRVTHAGQPVAGVRVYAREDNWLWQPPLVVTDATGAYQVEHLGTGEVSLEAGAADLVAARRTVAAVKFGDHLTGYDFAITSGVLLRGTVRRADNEQPAADVWVTASHDRWSILEGYEERTDAKGAYELRVPPGTYALGAFQPNFQPFYYWTIEPVVDTVTVREGAIQEHLDFTAAPPKYAHGQVLLPDGKPAAGATLAAQGGKIPYFLEDSLKTDAEGKFALEAWSKDQLYGGTAIVVASQPAAGLVGAANVEDFDQAVAIHLAPGVYLTETVTDQHDKPLAGAVLAAKWTAPDGSWSVDAKEAQSDERGVVRTGPLPAGTVRYSTRVQQGDMVVDKTAEQTVQLVAGETRALPAVQLDSAVHLDSVGRTVRGVVDDAQGRPVAEALVTTSAGGKTRTRTNDQGRFEITGLPAHGALRVLAMHPFQLQFACQTLEEGQAGELRLTLQPLGSLSGQVVDEQNRPVAGARVWAFAEDLFNADHAVRLRLALLEDHGEILTDAQGRWRWGGLIPGVTYTVRALPPAQTYPEVSAQATVLAKSGETVEVAPLQLQPNGIRQAPASAGPGGSPGGSKKGGW